MCEQNSVLQRAGWEEIVLGAGDRDWLRARPRSLAGDAPGAHGRGASLCTLGLVADFVISFLQTAGCSNSPVHPGSESGWSAGREGPGRARWQCGGSCSHQQLLLLLNHVTGRKAPTPPCRVSLGPPPRLAPGEVPRDPDKAAGCSLGLGAPTGTLQTVTPWRCDCCHGETVLSRVLGDPSRKMSIPWLKS